MLLEGIIVYKQTYKERDVIINLLLRSGDLISGYIYGGRGGGQFKKSDILQIGYCLRFKAHEPKARGQMPSLTFKMSDQVIIWQHEKIRKNYHAFSDLYYFCELHSKFALKIDSLDDMGSSGNEGLFTNLSNGLYFLDQFPEKRNLIKKILYIKLFYYLGVVPDIENCQFCQVKLEKIKSFLFYDDGLASCLSCLGTGHSHVGHELNAFSYHGMKKILGMKFLDLLQDKSSFNELDNKVMEKYLWHHFQLSINSFRSLNWQNS